MSISSPQFAAIVALVVAAPTPVAAQSSPEDVIGPILEEAEKAYRLEEPAPERPADCPEPNGNEIVVCAPIEGDPDRYRVTSSLEKGDDSHLAWTGQAPDVSGPGIFKGPATVGGLCFIPPCPKEPVYMIDVAALPEAPPGSDADRIARGLAPRGEQYDDGEGQVVAGEVAAPEPEPESRDPSLISITAQPEPED